MGATTTTSGTGSGATGGTTSGSLPDCSEYEQCDAGGVPGQCLDLGNGLTCVQEGSAEQYSACSYDGGISAECASGFVCFPAPGGPNGVCYQLAIGDRDPCGTEAVLIVQVPPAADLFVCAPDCALYSGGCSTGTVCRLAPDGGGLAACLPGTEVDDSNLGTQCTQSSDCFPVGYCDQGTCTCLQMNALIPIDGGWTQTDCCSGAGSEACYCSPGAQNCLADADCCTGPCVNHVCEN